jgi:hypothetical protein
MVTLFFLLVLGCVFSWMAVAKRNILVGVLSSIIWIYTFYYTHNTYPLGGFTAGSTGDTLGVAIFLGLALAIPLISWSFYRGQKKYDERNEQEWHNKEDERKAKNNPTYSDITDTSNSIDLMNLSDKDYADILRGNRKK